jgi:hypothetical protein
MQNRRKSRRRAGSIDLPAKAKLLLKPEPATTIIVLVLIYWFMLSRMNAGLLVTDEPTAGGDMVGYYYMAYHLHNQLLPRGEIIGWAPGWFAGFPMLQYYFPLTFLISAAAGYLIPLQVAYKLTALLGTFTLPVAMLASFRLLGFRFPAPQIAAVASLPFLFQNHYSIWGGNIMSTLSGEFSYSLSITFMVLFLGFIRWDIKRGRYWHVGSLLFAAIVLTHGITTIFAAVASAYFLLTRDLKKLAANGTYLLKTYALAFCLAAFYLVPLIAKGGYSTPHIWLPATAEQLPGMLMPPYLGPFYFLALIGAYHGLRRDDDRIPYILFCLAVAYALFFASYPLSVLGLPLVAHLMAIKFLPYAYLLVYALDAYALYAAAEAGKIGSAMALIALFAAIWWVGYINSPVTEWFNWNFAAPETKNMWGSFQEVNGFLAQSKTPGRVEFEWNGDIQHGGLGSSRTIEAMPVYSGRAMLKGTQFQGGYNSPYAYMIECEYSNPCPCPLFPVTGGCPGYNLTQAKKHLRMFNVKYLIADTDSLKAGLGNDSDFRLANTTRHFSVYELMNHGGDYVTVPEYEPVLAKTSDWKATALKWFNDSSLADIPLVLPVNTGQEDAGRFAQTVDADSDGLRGIRKEKLENDCHIDEKVTDERIDFKTDCVGKPHIVKISYYPNWQVEGAQKIYLVAPGFMLIFPEKEDVTIRYRNTAADTIGTLMTGASALALLAAAYRRLKRHGEKVTHGR